MKTILLLSAVITLLATSGCVMADGGGHRRDHDHDHDHDHDRDHDNGHAAVVVVRPVEVIVH